MLLQILLSPLSFPCVLACSGRKLWDVLRETGLPSLILTSACIRSLPLESIGDRIEQPFHVAPHYSLVEYGLRGICRRICSTECPMLTVKFSLGGLLFSVASALPPIESIHDLVFICPANLRHLHTPLYLCASIATNAMIAVSMMTEFSMVVLQYISVVP